MRPENYQHPSATFSSFDFGWGWAIVLVLFFVLSRTFLFSAWTCVYVSWTFMFPNKFDVGGVQLAD